MASNKLFDGNVSETDSQFVTDNPTVYKSNGTRRISNQFQESEFELMTESMAACRPVFSSPMSLPCVPYQCQHGTILSLSEPTETSSQLSSLRSLSLDSSPTISRQTCRHPVSEIVPNVQESSSLSSSHQSSPRCRPLSSLLSNTSSLVLTSSFPVTTSSTRPKSTISNLPRTTDQITTKCRTRLSADTGPSSRLSQLLLLLLASCSWSSSPVRQHNTSLPVMPLWIVMLALVSVNCCYLLQGASCSPLATGDQSSNNSNVLTSFSALASNATTFGLSQSAPTSSLLKRPKRSQSLPLASSVRHLQRRHAISRPVNFNSKELKLLDHLINHQQVNSAFHHKPQRSRLASHGLFESKSSEEMDVDQSASRLAVAAAIQRRDIQYPIDRMMALHGKTSSSPEAITNNVRQSMTNRMVSKAPKTYLTESESARQKYEQRDRDESNESTEGDSGSKLRFNLAHLSLSDSHALVKSVIQNGLIEQLDTKTLEYLALKYGYENGNRVDNGLDSNGQIVEVQLEDEDQGEDYESGTDNGPERSGSKLDSMVGINIQPMTAQEPLNPEEELLTSPFGSKKESEHRSEESLPSKLSHDDNLDSGKMSATLLRENVVNNYKNIDQVLEMLMRSEKTLKKRGEGPQLSIDSALTVLRERMLFELARRKAKATEKQIIENRKILEHLGRRRRSVSNLEQFESMSPTSAGGSKQARVSKLAIDCEQVNCNLDDLNVYWSNLHDSLRNTMSNRPNSADGGSAVPIRSPSSRWTGLYSSGPLASRNRFRNNDRYAAFERLVADNNNDASQNEIHKDGQFGKFKDNDDTKQEADHPQAPISDLRVSDSASQLNYINSISGRVRTNSRKPSQWFSKNPNKVNDDRNSYRLVSLNRLS